VTPPERKRKGEGVEFKAIKGFRDILPEEAPLWRRVEECARKVFRSFGFQEIKTPLLERTELFSRSIGQDTDIVSKEMYSLSDSKGRGLTLRPEATASVVRAYIEHRLYERQSVPKVFLIGPMFRHERPQKGRFRQFHQIDAELFGDPGPQSDVELILMAHMFLQTLGLEGLGLHINSLGCPGCRAPFKEKLVQYLEDCREALCADCASRVARNPLRVLDCKVEECRRLVAGAPALQESLCPECREHFGQVQAILRDAGVDFTVNPQLVRGLDYYTRTTFEIQTQALGAQNAVVGGGRYDGLVRLLGGPDHPAVGFAAGMERIVTLLEEQGEWERPVPDLFVAALGERARKEALRWIHELRASGLWVEMDYDPGRGLKAQMKRAGRMGARRVLMVGEEELGSGQGIVRDMASKEQESVPLARVVQRILDLAASPPQAGQGGCAHG